MEKHSPNSFEGKIAQRPSFADAKTGLYFHVPFCRSKCGYCDFYSLARSRDQMDAYTTAMVSAIASSPYTGRSVDTIYFGGGTPSYLPPQHIGALLEQAYASFSVDPHAEITVEANPEDASDTLFSALKGFGVNRLSFGVQSAVEQELEALNRCHTVATAHHALALAGEYFPHISADMMLGIPYQTEDSLRQSLEWFGQRPIDHLSIYMLLLEDSVPLYASPLMEQAADDDQLADFYLLAVQQAEEMGFTQYEISNFSKAGGESRHNLKYWYSHPYLGIGPSAHSYMDGKRFSFSPSLASFVENVPAFDFIQLDGSAGDWEEYAMLRLRLREGLSLSDMKERFPLWEERTLREQANRLVPHGLVEVDGDRVALTAKGFLLSNQVTAQLLYGA